MNIQNLAQHIPGGVHHCRRDDKFTLLSMNTEFLEILGYSETEIEEEFHNQFWELIYPPDRELVLQGIENQLQKGCDMQLEYRVKHKNRNLIWILDKVRMITAENGESVFCCLLVDITERKQEQENLRLLLERHQVIMDQATDIIFEWDIPEDTLLFSQNWFKKFGYRPIDADISQNIPLSNHIHEEDMQAFIKIMQDTAAGVPYSETEFRILDTKGSYCWCRVRATTQYDSDHVAIKAIGVITDIDTEKKQKQVLFDEAKKDSLTGLYNKATTNALVERKLQGEREKSYHSIFIIDIDYFKSINDTYGHLVGDSLLSQVADALKRNVRNSDLVGRIGGDEFLIYMADLEQEQTAYIKAEKLRSAIHKITPKQGARMVTCSIGVVVFTEEDQDYRSLYQKADQALYHRKESGRDGVTLYVEGMKEKDGFQPENTAISDDIISDRGTVINEQMPQYAFRTLYEATDVEMALNQLLEIIGRSYDVSRAYIFESSEDGAYCSNTFEWCNEGIPPQIDMLQSLSYTEDMDNYLEKFDTQGLFYCFDVQSTEKQLYEILGFQGIQSMLQSAMMDEGKFVGFVGFDECCKNRKWSEQHIATFQLIANIFSIFLVKLRQKQKLKKEIRG